MARVVTDKHSWVVEGCPYAVFPEQVVYHGHQGSIRRKALKSKKMLSIRDHSSDRLGQEGAMPTIALQAEAKWQDIFLAFKSSLVR